VRHTPPRRVQLTRTYCRDGGQLESTSVALSALTQTADDQQRSASQLSLVLANARLAQIITAFSKNAVHDQR